MRPKRRIPVSREARWRTKVQTWPNMSSRRADSCSDSTSNSNEELSDGPFEEGGHRKTWLEDEVQANQEELSEASNAGTRAPPSPQVEEDTTVFWKPKVGICLSSDSAKAGSMQGLHDEPVEMVESATSSRDINNTGCEKRSVPAMPARRSFDCTTCGMKLFSLREIKKHPDLGVGICRVCYNFLFSSPYTKDKIDCSEEQCRWCGQGGRVVMCDDCDKVFCEACIVRNFGPKDLSLIVQRSKWTCFCCDPELLRVPIKELEEFQASVQRSTSNFPVKRKGPWAGNLITRNANDIILGTGGEGATIAELLAQEEERRKQNKGTWTNSGSASRKKNTARRKKKAASTFNPELLTCAKVRLPATVEVKQHEVAIEKQQAPAARTWIRPHQMVQKRQEAAERRKRAVEAEAERLKNVTNLPNDGPKTV